MSERSATVGEAITRTTSSGDTIREKVGAYCDTGNLAKPEHRAPGGHWYCLTHQTGFRNNLETNSHTGAGEHLMIWVCDEHGAEVESAS